MQPDRGQSKPDDRSGPQNFPVDHAVGLLAPAHQSGEIHRGMSCMTHWEIILHRATTPEQNFYPPPQTYNNG